VFLAALFGAIQAHVNATLNSVSTIFSLDIYKRLLKPNATDRELPRVGMVSSAVILAISIVLGGLIGKFKEVSLFEYIQSLYAFFAPPFAAVFVLGILFRRINAQGATVAVFLGFLLGIAVQGLCQRSVRPPPAGWSRSRTRAIRQLGRYARWCACWSASPRPVRDPEQVTADLTMNWSRMDIFGDLGAHWYSSVLLWWGIFLRDHSRAGGDVLGQVHVGPHPRPPLRSAERGRYSSPSPHCGEGVRG